MANILNEIGLFQFTNLVKNRVPFALFVIDFTMPELFQDFNDKHIQQCKIELGGSDIVAEAKKRELPLERGIIVLCQTGVKAVALVDQLEHAGYKNVYFVPGGFDALVKEKQSS